MYESIRPPSFDGLTVADSLTIRRESYRIESLVTKKRQGIRVSAKTASEGFSPRRIGRSDEFNRSKKPETRGFSETNALVSRHCHAAKRKNREELRASCIIQRRITAIVSQRCKKGKLPEAGRRGRQKQSVLRGRNNGKNRPSKCLACLSGCRAV